MNSMKKFHISVGQIDGDRDYQEDYLETDILDINSSLLILADGMGGYKGGEKASKTVVKSFKSAFDKSNPNIKDALHKALLKANEALKKEKIKAPDLEQMGTTLIAVYMHIDFIQWVSVGDSPLWLVSTRYDRRYHKPKIQRINKNHSIAGLLQLQLEHGEITKQEMESSPNKHMLTSAITGDEISLVDLSEKVSINRDDILVLASDGVETLQEKEILDIVLNSKSIETSAEEILESIKLKDRSEQDNSSIIVITNKEKKVDTQPILNKTISNTKESNKNKLILFVDNNYNLIHKILIFILVLLSFILLFIINHKYHIISKVSVKENKVNLYRSPKNTLEKIIVKQFIDKSTQKKKQEILS